MDPIRCYQSGPGCDANKEVLHIPQSSSITGVFLSDCLVSYIGALSSLQRCSRCNLQPEPTGPSTLALSSEYSFGIKAIEPSLLYYLSISGGRGIKYGFISSQGNYCEVKRRLMRDLNTSCWFYCHLSQSSTHFVVSFVFLVLSFFSFLWRAYHLFFSWFLNV